MCSVHLVADSTFYKHNCGSKPTVCAAKLFQALRYIDVFYRRQTFGSILRKGLGFKPIELSIAPVDKSGKDPLEGSSNDVILEFASAMPNEREDTCLQMWLSHRDWKGVKGVANVGTNCRNYQIPGLCKECQKLLKSGADDVLYGLCGYRYRANLVAISTVRIESRLKPLNFGKIVARFRTLMLCCTSCDVRSSARLTFSLG